MRTTKISLGWKALRDAAVTATRWGWPVIPGTFPDSNQRWYGRDDASRLCPSEDTWAQTPVTDRTEAYEIWSENPYSLLLVCGRGVDALELPQERAGLRPTPTVPQIPVAVRTPIPRWLLFTATGSGALTGELAQAGVSLHTAGSWMALLPTTVEPRSPQRWLAPPPPSPDGLPDAETVQHALLTALLGSGLSTGPGDDDEDVVPAPGTAPPRMRGCHPCSAPQALAAGISPAPHGALTGPNSPPPHRGSVRIRENQEAPPALPPAAVGPPGHTAWPFKLGTTKRGISR